MHNSRLYISNHSTWMFMPVPQTAKISGPRCGNKKMASYMVIAICVFRLFLVRYATLCRFLPDVIFYP